jgi:hypothetical protein
MKFLLLFIGILYLWAVVTAKDAFTASKPASTSKSKKHVGAIKSTNPNQNHILPAAGKQIEPTKVAPMTGNPATEFLHGTTFFHILPNRGQFLLNNI